MSTIIVGILLVAVTFILVGYGSWFSYDKLNENAARQVVSGSADRLVLHVYSVRDQIGRVPATAEVDSTMFTRETRTGLIWTYVGLTATSGYICGRAPVKRSRDAALSWEATSRGGKFGGTTCDTTGGSTSGFSTLTIPVSMN